MYYHSNMDKRILYDSLTGEPGNNAKADDVFAYILQIIRDLDLNMNAETLTRLITDYMSGWAIMNAISSDIDVDYHTPAVSDNITEIVISGLVELDTNFPIHDEYKNRPADIMHIQCLHSVTLSRPKVNFSVGNIHRAVMSLVKLFPTGIQKSCITVMIENKLEIKIKYKRNGILFDLPP